MVKKNINELKSLNFFKDVKTKIKTAVSNSKIIDYTVEEKPTGEISAGLVGTSGEVIEFAVRENNI